MNDEKDNEDINFIEGFIPEENNIYPLVINSYGHEVETEEELNDTFICQSCFERFSKENMGTSELAMNDNICEFCMKEGYGE